MNNNQKNEQLFAFFDFDLHISRWDPITNFTPEGCPAWPPRHSYGPRPFSRDKNSKSFQHWLCQSAEIPPRLYASQQSAYCGTGCQRNMWDEHRRICEITRHVLDVQDMLVEAESEFERGMSTRDHNKFTKIFRRAIKIYKVTFRLLSWFGLRILVKWQLRGPQ